MRIKAEFLRPGMVISNNVYMNERRGVPIYFANHELNENDIRVILSKRDVLETPNIRTKIENNEAVDQETKDILIDDLKEYNISSIIGDSRTLIRKIQDNLYDDPSKKGKPKYKYDLSKHLIRENDEYSAIVEVTILATALAKIYNNFQVNDKKQVDIQNVTTAAILSDIGSICKQKAKLDEVRTYAKENIKLDKNEFAGYSDNLFDIYDDKYKGLYGYVFLKMNSAVSVPIQRTLLRQDETLNGTGPLGAILPVKNETDNYISEILPAKIIKVCKTYYSVLNEVLGKEESPSKIIEVMRSFAEEKEIDPLFTDILLKYIPIYSIGTKVVLSNNIEATVIETSEANIDKPTVKIDKTGVEFALSEMSIIKVKAIAKYKLEELIEKEKEIEQEDKPKAI